MQTDRLFQNLEVNLPLTFVPFAGKQVVYSYDSSLNANFVDRRRSTPLANH